MFTRLQELFDQVDLAVDTIRRQHPAETRCKPGCADCCHAVFDISFIEASYLASFLIHARQLRRRQTKQAEKAAASFEKLLAETTDLSTARIRCPLLSRDNLCLAHDHRPINCRTYGTPTIIGDRGHVCGLSGFQLERAYPTINLEPLQQRLQKLSCELVGEEFGTRRFPIAWVLLKTGFFLPR